ncbi:GNAT family N-acetyltransferase [Bacillus sp. A301a_S52]|nr:GNAT family N-acetyltransferase [Bacillus sp. A301a_S52]
MIEYRRPEMKELKGIAKMSAITFGDYPIFHEFSNEFSNMDSFIDLMSEVQHVYLKAYYKNADFFVGEENGQIKSFAVLIRPNSSKVSIFDYFLSGAFKLLRKASLRKLLKLLNILEEGHGPISEIKEQSWVLESLAVDKSCRGQQLGTKMLNDCIIPYISKQSSGTKETFVTFTNTERNKKFYLKNGFTEFDYTPIERKGTTIGNWSFRMTIDPARPAIN